MKFNPNVENQTLKGVRGNWEEPKAYISQKHMIGGMKYVQGAGTTAAKDLSNQLGKLSLAPKAAPIAARKASASPNRAIVAKNAPAAQIKPKPTLKPAVAPRVPLKKANSNSPNIKK